MALLRTLAPLAARHLRGRAIIFVAMAGIAYALASSAPTHGQGAISACASGDYADYYASLPFGALAGVASCATCHTSAPALSPFGTDYAATAQVFFAAPTYTYYVHSWTTALALGDSDGDGYTNGEELQDPQGLWRNGDPDPPGGASSRVSNPDDPAALPPAPTITQLGGVSAASTVQGTLSLQALLDTTVGARKLVYDILDGGGQVVRSYTRQSSGYTAAGATFFLSWDSNDVPNGTYTIRATLADASGNPARNSVRSVAGVTVSNPARALRYVAPGGQDSGDCTSGAAPCASLGYAVGQAQNNDEIRIAAGSYPVGSAAGPLAVGVRVSLRGGFAPGSWATPDPQANQTVLDGQKQRPLLAFGAGADGFSVSGLTIANGAGSRGAGVAISGASGSFSQVTFSGNTASGDGGALAVDSAGGATLERVSFFANTAGGRGSAIFSQAPLALTNALVAQNSAATGGSIAISAAGASQLTYVTVAGGGRADPAIWLDGAANQTTITNALISGHSQGVQMAASGPSLTLQRVLVADDVNTPIDRLGGSLSGAPLRGPAGFVNEPFGDYRLAFGAPAIDAGQSTPAIADDRDGSLRPSGPANDLGAYEFLGPAGQLFFYNISPNVQLPAASATLEVRLSVASVSPVSVHYATSDGSATAGVDYTATSGDLSFAPGETSKTIAVPLLSPSPAITRTRSFAVALSAPSGATLGSFSSAVVSLLPPPDPPRVTLTADVAEASRYGPRPARVTFERDVASATPLTVAYTLGGDAQAGVDFAPLTGEITFPAGALSATLPIAPIGGAGERLLTVSLQPGAGYLLGRRSVTVRITGVYQVMNYLPLLTRAR